MIAIAVAQSRQELAAKNHLLVNSSLSSKTVNVCTFLPDLVQSLQCVAQCNPLYACTDLLAIIAPL